MAVIVEFDGARPVIGEGVYLAPTAALIGNVEVGARSSVWFGAVLRGDSSSIHVGEETSVQDNAVIHCAQGLPTMIGDGVIVGHSALLEGCVIEDGAIVGMGAIALQRSRLGEMAMLAAGSVLAEGACVGARMLAAGSPARERKELSGSALRWSQTAAGEYQEYRRRYLAGAVVVTGEPSPSP
jgi:carbonic anhydrase/acetyltransferase-like protein (isoleucine patch superfamily)